MQLIAEARAQEAAPAQTGDKAAASSPFAAGAKPADVKTESGAADHGAAKDGAAMTLVPSNGGSLPEDAPKPAPWMSIAPLAAVFVIFYFFVIRPQNKRYKEHQEMQRGVKRGDRIVTTGGIVGKVVRVQEDGVLHVEIADKVVIHLERDGVSRLHTRQDDVKSA